MSGLFSTGHLLALLAVAAFTAGLIACARHRSLGWTRLAARVLSVVLIADEVVWWVYLADGPHRLDLAQSLPLQLCDALILVAAAALWLRLQLLFELTYFCGLAASAQALLTPDLPDRFLSFPFFQYYIAHGGVVAAALFLVIGLRLQPRPGSVWRVAGITLAFTAFVGMADAVTGGNYMYLRSKPPVPTALDLFGPWPWYLGAAAFVGLLLLLLLDAPFRMRRESQTAYLTPALPGAAKTDESGTRLRFPGHYEIDTIQADQERLKGGKTRPTDANPRVWDTGVLDPSAQAALSGAEPSR